VVSSGVSGSIGGALSILIFAQLIFLTVDRCFYTAIYPEFPEIQILCWDLITGLESQNWFGFPEFPEVAAGRPGDVFGIVKG